MKISKIKLFFLIILILQPLLVNSSVIDNSNFNAKLSVSKWPKLSLLNSKEETRLYSSLWNPKKTLKENQQNLANLFISTCCDFSFKKANSSLQGVYFGTVQSKEKLIFTDETILLRKKEDSDQILLCRNYYTNDTQSINLPTSNVIFPEITPMNFQDWMKLELKKQILNIASDSVGCEILRMSICKYYKNNRHKITFIPVKTQSNLNIPPETNLWLYENASSISPNKKIEETKFIFFNPKWFQSDEESFLLKINPKNILSKDEFIVFQGIMPKEATLLHQILYALNLKSDSDFSNTSLIEDRSFCDYFYFSFPKLGRFIIPKEQFNVLLFNNDITYQTMFGLTSNGITSISESAYLAHKYNIMRPAYIGTNTQISINKKKLSSVKSLTLIKHILGQDGDRDLYRYYLSNNSYANYPEFGYGNYMCSDFNPTPTISSTYQNSKKIFKPHYSQNPNKNYKKTSSSFSQNISSTKEKEETNF